MIISTVIVIFVSRIRSLESILNRAKEIDRAKEERLIFLDEALNKEKMKSFSLEKELQDFEENKSELTKSRENLRILNNKITNQEKRYIDKDYTQRTAFEELKIRHEVLLEQYEKIEEAHYLLKQSNEHLMDNNNILHTQNRELVIKLSEQEKQMAEKMQIMKEYRGDLKEEFEELALKFFEGKHKT
jgi:chromosome segregation ATPase